MVNTTESQVIKSDDKKDIETEEKEKMLASEIKEKSGEENQGDDKETTKIKVENLEGREVKPKKIPIGGIQMPGFFMRSKSKEKCKEGESEQDIEGTELLEQGDKDKKEESLISQARIKLPNPFRKSKMEDDGDKSDLKEKRKLMDAIRLPLVSIRKRKKESETGLEAQAATAGLASSETLDDNDKTADKKGGEMKNVPLDDKKDVEKQDQNDEEPTWKQRLKMYRFAISALLVFILVTIIIIAVLLSGKSRPVSMPIRDGKYIEAVTQCGKVEGILEDGGVAFRGIPYARPPLGPLRFKAAQPLDDLKYCWNDTETLLTHNATDYCMQIYENGTLAGVEDCLTLDIVTPYVRYDNPLPVVVLIGADSLIGGSPGKMRPSARFARYKDVVFVRPNFRLGTLGFLALNSLSKSDYPPISGNYGLSDIVQALKWIQLNIENFGGNKNAVTLFGHKAGGTLVTALATIKGSEKLFARAWSSSGSALYPKKELNEAEKENESFNGVFDCKDADCLRKIPAEKLMQSIEDTWRKPQPDLPLKNEDPEKRHEWLVLDGKLLQDHPAATWASEDGLKVKLVIGTTAHSASSEKLLMRYTNWTEDLVVNHVKNSALSNLKIAEDALKMYNKTYKGLTAMISDIRKVCPLFAITIQMYKVPFYVVTQTRGEHDLADVDSDVDAILGRYEPKTPEQRRYVSAMQQLFYYFVWHGEIQQNAGIAHKVLVVGQDTLPASTYSHCDFWINKDVALKYAQLD